MMTLVRFAVGWYVLCLVQLEAIFAAFHGGVKGQGDVEEQDLCYYERHDAEWD
jgi:hypothetical protein